ncbi:hypothetical protein SEUCBS140593_002846 [Sporothrix eucalyptigena]|uniref:Uncharacterized protein n=1 Tax=Sporothrix eucalyptigena TaxID=1812306 RepID=A0ABP0B9X9_9PEZI
MPRFPVAFNRRKSTADNLDNVAVAGPSFRVLDRSEVVSGAKNFDTPSARLAVKSQSMPNTLSVVDPEDDNIFANLNVNRGSGSSNTTKTTSDNSSRHSNVSTAPSSADLNTQQQQQQQFQQQFHQQQQQQHQQEDFRLQNKKLYGDVPVPPIPKSNTTSSFLKSAGRTFSFGGGKRHLPVLPDNQAPQTPPSTGRDRSMTASTVTTATPPKLDEEFTLDLGGDFSKMLGGGFDKRASVMTVRDDGADRPALAPRTLTGNRLNQPTPIQVDSVAKIEPSPYSWGSQNSNERLLYSNSLMGTSPNENAPPPVPRHASPTNRPQTSSGGTPSVAQHSVPPIPTSFTDSSLKRSSALFGRRRSTIDNAAQAEDEDTVLLKDSLFTVNRFLAGANLSSAAKSSSSPSSRFGRDALGVGYSQVPTESTSPTLGAKAVADDDDNLFDTNLVHSSRMAQRFVARKPSPPRNKVMTPAQFERYRKDKEREDGNQSAQVTKQDEKDDEEEEDNYEDDEDEAEKSRQAAKQRRKQEAHMAVYRQQMMKVTGEAASGTPARSSMHLSMSTPNLPTMGSLAPGGQHGSGLSPQTGSEAEGEDEDEEVPLAILAAHGFPNKNRPPTRLSTMMSNPNLRQAAAPSYQRPQSVVGGDAPAASGGRLPVFARNLPQDPYGLINSSNRETPNFAGGAPAGSPQVNGGLPPGGLVGVIASEERSRAMRRGSPNIEAANKPLPNMALGQQFDPMAGIPSHMMYPGMGMQQPMLTPGDQAQIQMTQQMQQFMQMQMQFMQMMANGGGNGMQRPVSSQFGGPGGQMNMGMMGGMDGMGGMGGMSGMNGMGGMNNDMARHSFMDNGSVMDMQLPRPDMHMRTMSMVQPSSASWMQQPQMPGYAPSIRVQGANGYAPSIAPSERSNVGLPGRYRPVSQMPAGPAPSDLRKSMTMSGALGSTVGDSQTSATTTPRPNTSGSMSPNENNLNTRGPSPTGWDISRKQKSPSPLNKANVADDDDDEEGWAAMKAKRDKKRSLWKSKKTLSSELGSLIS